MLGPEHVEVANLLLRKARDDSTAAEVLAARAEIAGHIIGFHAQQAVEKALKAVLVVHEIEIPLTHNLAALVTQLRAVGLDLPDAVSGADWLTPWAVTFRYDDEPRDVDRERAVGVARSAVVWAAEHVPAEA